MHPPAHVTTRLSHEPLTVGKHKLPPGTRAGGEEAGRVEEGLGKHKLPPGEVRTGEQKRDLGELPFHNCAFRRDDLCYPHPPYCTYRPMCRHPSAHVHPGTAHGPGALG